MNQSLSPQFTPTNKYEKTCKKDLSRCGYIEVLILDAEARENNVEIYLQDEPNRNLGDLVARTAMYSADIIRAFLNEAARQARCPEGYLQLLEYCEDEEADYGTDQGILIRFSTDENGIDRCDVFADFFQMRMPKFEQVTRFNVPMKYPLKHSSRFAVDERWTKDQTGNGTKFSLVKRATTYRLPF